MFNVGEKRITGHGNSYWDAEVSNRIILTSLIRRRSTAAPHCFELRREGAICNILSAQVLVRITPVVRSLQTLLTNGAPGRWGTTPQGIDGDFRPHTEISVESFQAWGGVVVDSVVGDQTWSVSLDAASATLETAVGLNFVIG